VAANFFELVFCQTRQPPFVEMSFDD